MDGHLIEVLPKKKRENKIAQARKEHGEEKGRQAVSQSGSQSVSQSVNR